MKENTIVDELIEMFRAVDDLHIRYLKSKGLTRGAFFMLYYLRKSQDGMEPSEIAEKVLIKRQLTTALLNHFEALGYLYREVSKADHRKRIVNLTGSGKAFIDQVYSDICNLDRSGLAEMTDEEQLQMLTQIRRYYLGMQKKQLHPNYPASIN